jgi:anaerobic selenocysteine-containing dehydrogenase
LTHGQFPEATFDIDRTDYVVATGRSVGPNVANACGSTKRFLDAVERGMKLVAVDPRRSVEGSKAYRWVPVRPGTETAFALSIIHSILYEVGKFDVWFVKNRTNGPYLIGPDGHYVRHTGTGKPLVWDAEDGHPKTFDDESIEDYSLEGERDVNGVRARPAFQVMKDSMKGYTPEWAEEITTIPAETTRTIAREFVEHARIGSTIMIDGFEFPYRPAVFTGSGRGSVSHQGGMYFDLAGKIINALVGSIEVPGGITGNRSPGPSPAILEPNEDGLVKPISEAIGWVDMWHRKYEFKPHPDFVDMSEFYPVKHTAPHIVAKAILNPEKYHLNYDVEAFMMCGSNAIRSCAQRQTLIEAFKKVPFIFTISLIFDEPTMMADIVLPEDSFMERSYASVYRPQHQTQGESLRGVRLAMGREPVGRLHNTRNVADIVMDLADRIGILRGEGGLNDAINRGTHLEGPNRLELDRRYRIEEILDRTMKSNFGNEYGLNYVEEHGFVTKLTAPGKMGYNYFYHPGNQTRHPIYFEHLKAVGDELRSQLDEQGIGVPGWSDMEEFFSYYEPVPRWIPSHEFRGPGEYDLFAINWKTNFMPFGTGDTQENPWLHELRTKDPYEMRILVNRETATRKRLKDGDWVWVESRYGKTKGRIKLTELIHPEVVGIGALYGSGTMLMNPTAKEGPYFNSLISIDENASIDPLDGGLDIGPRVKVYRA